MFVTIIIVLFALVVGIYLFQKRQSTKVAETLKKLKKGEYTLVDVREKQELSSGSIGEAINLPLSTFENTFNKLNKSKTIIVFCKSGVRATAALSILKKNGYSKTINGGSYMILKDLF